MDVVTLGAAKADAKKKYASKATEEAARQQSVFLGSAMRKLRKNQAVTFCVVGDSLTYGYDTTSADVVAPPAGALPDGSFHTYTRSPKPWPEAMGDCLNEVYGGTVTIVNQGYSGDSVTRSINRWTINPNADFTWISLGTNDAQATFIPDYGNVEVFVNGMEAIILKRIAWGSAVGLVTPMRLRGSTGNLDIDTFRNAWYGLAAKYGLPVIDGETLLLNMNRDAWSDGTHFNTKGYGIIGAKMAATMLGESPAKALPVASGTKLLTRPGVDGFVAGAGVTVANSTLYPTADENVEGQGFAAELKSTESVRNVYWSFYTATPDLVIHPFFYLDVDGGTSNVEVTLDFGAEQGDNYVDQGVDAPLSFTELAPSSFTKNWTGVGIWHHNSVVNMPADQQIRVATPGWHTLRFRVTSSGTVNSANIYALEFIDYRVLKALREQATQSRLSAGQATMNRREVTSSAAATGNGSLRLTYFTATRTETVTTFRTICGATAGVAPTLARIGIYKVEGAGFLTLVGSTTNDTSLWTAANTSYSKSLTYPSGSIKLYAGQRYAIGVLVVGSTTAPSLCGATVLTADEAAVSPRLCGLVSGQTDLPSTVATASVSNSSIQTYAAIA